MGTPSINSTTPVRPIISPVGIPTLRRDPPSYSVPDCPESNKSMQDASRSPQKLRISFDLNTKESLCPNFMRLPELKDAADSPVALIVKNPFRDPRGEGSQKSPSGNLFFFSPEDAAELRQQIMRPTLSPMDVRSPSKATPQPSPKADLPPATLKTAEGREDFEVGDGFGHKKTYTPEEDRMLLELVGKYGEKNWSKIAELMPGRNRKQLRDHYINFLKKMLCRKEFTLEEDRTILAVVKKYGHSWKRIADLLPGRTPIMIKNRYNSKLKKRRGKNSALDLPASVLLPRALSDGTPSFGGGEESSSSEAAGSGTVSGQVLISATIDNVRKNIQSLQLESQ